MVHPILWSLDNRDINALHGYPKNPRKWQQFTGEEATHTATGETFNSKAAS